jgi:hypothetical protein
MKIIFYNIYEYFQRRAALENIHEVRFKLRVKHIEPIRSNIKLVWHFYYRHLHTKFNRNSYSDFREETCSRTDMTFPLCVHFVNSVQKEHRKQTQSNFVFFSFLLLTDWLTSLLIDCEIYNENLTSLIPVPYNELSPEPVLPTFTPTMYFP